MVAQMCSHGFCLRGQQIFTLPTPYFSHMASIMPVTATAARHRHSWQGRMHAPCNKAGQCLRWCGCGTSTSTSRFGAHHPEQLGCWGLARPLLQPAGKHTHTHTQPASSNQARPALLLYGCGYSTTTAGMHTLNWPSAAVRRTRPPQGALKHVLYLATATQPSTGPGLGPRPPAPPGQARPPPSPAARWARRACGRRPRATGLPRAAAAPAEGTCTRQAGA